MNVIEEEVEKFLERSFSSISFVKPFCVCGCRICEKIPTLWYNLPCNCMLCNKCFLHQKDTWISVKCKDHGRRFHEKRAKKAELKLDDVLQAEAHCKNEAQGCSYTATIKKLKTHESDECGCNRAKCPFICGAELFLKDLTEHVSNSCTKRFQKCPYCKEDVRKSVEQIHQQSCMKFPEKCEHCTKEIERYKLKEHKEKCEQRPFACRFEVLGCTRGGSRGNDVHQETIENHIGLFIDGFKILAEVRKEQEEQRESINEEIEILLDQSNGIIELARRTAELLEQRVTSSQNTRPEQGTDTSPTEPPPPDGPDGPSCGRNHCSTAHSVEIDNSTQDAPVHDTQEQLQSSSETPTPSSPENILEQLQGESDKAIPPPNENIRNSTQNAPACDAQRQPQGSSATPTPSPVSDTQGQPQGSNLTPTPNPALNTQGQSESNSATPAPSKDDRNSTQNPSMENTQGPLQGNNGTPSPNQETQQEVQDRVSKDEADNVRNSTKNPPTEDDQRQLQGNSATPPPNENIKNSTQDATIQGTQRQPQASSATPSPSETRQKVNEEQSKDELGTEQDGVGEESKNEAKDGAAVPCTVLANPKSTTRLITYGLLMTLITHSLLMAAVAIAVFLFYECTPFSTETSTDQQ